MHWRKSATSEALTSLVQGCIGSSAMVSVEKRIDVSIATLHGSIC